MRINKSIVTTFLSLLLSGSIYAAEESSYTVPLQEVEKIISDNF